MPDTIRDGQGTGFLAGVDKDNRLKVTTKSQTLQHLISQENQEAYQVIGESDLSADTITALHIKNLSNTQEMIITYVRFQIIDALGGTAFPTCRYDAVGPPENSHQSGND